MYDEIDLEDLECRLYSQVYHSVAGTEEINVPSNIDQVTFIQLNAESCTSSANIWPRVVDSGTFNFESTDTRTSERNLNNQFQNNISVNQYILPLINTDQDKTIDIYSHNAEKFVESHTGSANISRAFDSNTFNSCTENNTSERNLTNQFQNNISVNQYILPLINTEQYKTVDENSYTAEKFFVPWCRRNKKLLNPKNRKQQRKLENRRRNNKKRAQNNQLETNGEAENTTSHIIFVSDESDDGECVIVNETCKPTEPFTDLNSDCNSLGNMVNNSDDDDIIYIPPPPIEVINVDVEDDHTENICEVPKTIKATENLDQNKLENVSTSTGQNTTKSSSTVPHELSNSPESCTANDFLDSSGVENVNNFNFSLHGSDFNNTADFLRPTNPVEYCETESSCSTNDCNRENNSVKTIVFNEVDFPKEDIFSDKNLEGFGTYITPKRSTDNVSKVNHPKKSSKHSNEATEDDTPSSSSESDYESTDTPKKSNLADIECNRKLPVLSPMQIDKTVTPNKTLTKGRVKIKPCSNKLQATSYIKKHSSRRKSNSIVDTNCNINEEESIKTKLTKKKKKADKMESITEDPSKKSNKTLDNNKDINSDSSSSIEEFVDTSSGGGSAKKKIKTHNTESNLPTKHIKDTIIEAKTLCEENNTFHKRKKKNNHKTSVTDNTSSSSSSEVILGRVKKRKVKSTSQNPSENIHMNNSNNSLSETKEIVDNSIQNSLLNNNSAVANIEKICNSLEELADQGQHNETLISSAILIDNKCDSDKIVTESQLQNQELNETHNFKSEHTTNVSNEIDTDDEVIFIDEIGAGNSNLNTQSSIKKHIEIVVSSDSENDFTDLRDVGQDLELANCAVGVATSMATHSSELTDIGGTSISDIMNKNLCEDFSKFDVEQIQNTQSDDPEVWKVSNKDRFMFLNTNVNKGPRCHRCRQFGHIAVRCTEKSDPPTCSLCGFPDHQEPRCPNKRCNQCGNEGDYSTTYCWKCFKFRNSVCHICNIKGHVANMCPDLWRRYHLTIEEGPIVVSEEPQLKPRDQLWCSGCAGQGHLEYECDYYNREYPPTTPCIVSYENVLHKKGGRSKTPEHTITTPAPLSLVPSDQPAVSTGQPLVPTGQVPVWNSPNKNNFCNVPSTSFSNIPSQNTINNIPVFIPPLMSHVIHLNPLLAPTFGQNSQIMMPNLNCAPNFTPSATQVLNPFSALAKQGKNAVASTELNRMKLNYVKDSTNVDHTSLASGKEKLDSRTVKFGVIELLKNDQKRIKQIIMSMPSNELKRFFGKELTELEDVVSQSDPKYLRKKLFKYDNMPTSKRGVNYEFIKEKCFWFRILNMFIFGVHYFRDGKVHINYIKQFLTEPKQNKLDNHKRKSLLNAYNYIFNSERHVNLNYHKTLQQLIQKYNDEKLH